MFGDVLRAKVHLLAGSSTKKCGDDAFWIILRNIAVEDIKSCYPEKVDSVNAVKIYYTILKENEHYIPAEFVETMPSNGQEKYRVKNRNMWTSNAFHPDGLANQEGIHAERLLNENRKGDRIVYQGEPTNEKFKYLMDCLNDRLNKKDLGAFYTPEPYCQKAAELVEKAVARVPDGNDYIILDRCAGTGNLESALYGKYDKNGDELISHCIVSTYEYYEYKVLLERIGQDVRNIIPPTEAQIEFANGMVSNADAMSEEYINNPLIKQYVDDPKCTIILFENPPYRDIAAQDKTAVKTKSFVYEQFVLNGSDNASHRDLSNLFIWSGFHFYMRQPEDSYIVFSPVKYFKSLNIVNATYEDGLAFNRKYFHATDSVISCVRWSNIPSVFTKGVLHPLDLVEGEVIPKPDIVVKKALNTFVPFSDKRTFVTDIISSITVNNGDGYESSKATDLDSVYNQNIVGFLRATSFNLNGNSRCLTRTITYDALTQHYGFYLRNDNYKDKLPLWVAKMFPQDDWYEKDVYFTTSDGGDAYTHDPQFLKSCLIYTCLSNQNKCLSFDGSDGRRYQNELCFDDSRADKPLALQDLNKYAALKDTAFDDEEEKLLEVWKQIMEEAKKTAGYNPEFNYGVYQVTKELNTSHVVGTGKSKKTVYDYPVLNGHLDTLRVMLKAYYKSHITEKMFKYELLK